MSETLRYVAPAKINLGLTVHGRRPIDGYHELETVFYRVLEPHDTLTVTPSAFFRFSCSNASLPVDDRNLVMRAANLFAETLGVPLPAIDVHLEKRIPMGAGLGGGSSDAATMLQILEEQTPGCGPGAIRKISDIGRRLGADIPFFLSGAHMAHATGIGETLTPIDLELGRSILILFDPKISVSTKDAYADLKRGIDPAHHAERPSLDAHAIAVATEQAVRSGTMTNDFEPSVFARHPRLLSMKQQLLQAGAKSALMTGSGAAMFGLFRDMTRALAARDHFAKQEGLLTFLS